MRLDHAISQSTTCQEFCKIFDRKVDVQIDTFWGVDRVKVEGYQGTVSTDLIANQISAQFGRNIEENQQEAALKLANLLKEKIFIRLRDRIKELDRSSCMLTLSYKVRNCARIGWTPEDRDLTAGYFVLKHSMCVMFLNKSL